MDDLHGNCREQSGADYVLIRSDQGGTQLFQLKVDEVNDHEASDHASFNFPYMHFAHERIELERVNDVHEFVASVLQRGNRRYSDWHLMLNEDQSFLELYWEEQGCPHPTVGWENDY